MKIFLITILTFSLFGSTPAKTKVFRSIKPFGYTLILHEDSQFQLRWNEGLWDFNLFGEFSISNGKLYLKRHDKVHFDYFSDIENRSNDSIVRYSFFKEMPSLSSSDVSPLKLGFFDSIVGLDDQYSKDSNFILCNKSTSLILYKNSWHFILSKDWSGKDVNSVHVKLSYPNYEFETQILIGDIKNKKIIQLNGLRDKTMKFVRE